MITEGNDPVINSIELLREYITKQFDKVFEVLKDENIIKLTIEQKTAIFKQDLFDYFANNYHLCLIESEMCDIIHFINSHYPLNIKECSNDELLNIFDKVIQEINRRKENSARERTGANG